MISIAAHHRSHILLVPIIEHEMIIVSLLGPAPGIKRFIHHYQAHSIAQFEQLGSRRIVTGADRVDAHLFENLKLTFQRAHIDCGAERA